MNNKQNDPEAYRALQLMSELENEQTVSQRELAGRLGIAVGLVNSCLKNFVAKGYVRVKNYPRNRYAYLLTPKGIAEKSRLAYQHLDYFTGLYTTTRREYLQLFRRLKAEGVGEVVFCGIDEVAEIAYLSLHEAGLALSAVFDEQTERNELFGHPVMPLAEAAVSARPIVVTSLKRRDHLAAALLRLGVNAENVHVVGGDR